ncbi:hypothetical protein llg_21730 [Luteolibacter sp. LG18]|nr:hypothetical protein llg_21730 [Luteolibacter sp. LG18]
MIRWIPTFLLMPVLATAAGEPAPAKPGNPEVAAMIPAAVAAIAEPGLHEFQGGLKMAVTAADQETQAHVVEGLDHLHGGWEFEAARHFAAAAKRDPNCLLAHWGMAVALIAPNPETISQRDAAVERMLTLVDAGVGNELERGYAYGLIQYFKEGPAGAADAFRKLSERFPNDLQAKMFAALFGRGGYDEFDKPTEDQERSEKILSTLLDRYPDSTVLLNALLTIRAEGPDLEASLPLARKLCELAPNYPPYFQLLGHYEWRTGNHAKAAAAFARASTLFEEWMKNAKVTALDCPAWVAAESYRAVALASKGDFDTALAAATALAGKKVPVERAASPGGRMLLWEAKTLPARLLMSRGAKGDAAKALASLPKAEEIATYKDRSLARWYVDGLRIDLDGLRQIDEGKLGEAAKVSEAFSHHGETFAQIQKVSQVSGERSFWNRSFRAMEVLASELRGRQAQAGPKAGQGSAYNWFRAAADRQSRATMLLPPAVLTPMALRVGDFQMATGKPADAVESYREALKAFPNDMACLKGLVAACEKAGLAEEATKVRGQIEALSAP